MCFMKMVLASSNISLESILLNCFGRNLQTKTQFGQI
jgi:hypothetical protein